MRSKPTLCFVILASFPGSHAPERKHWSCAGMESLVFFLTWAPPKVERGCKDLNCVWAYPKAQNRKGAKVAGSFRHVPSYQGTNIIHTERRTHSRLNNTQKMLPFRSKNWSYFDYDDHVRKDTRFSLQLMFAFQRSLWTRLLLSVPCSRTLLQLPL